MIFFFLCLSPQHRCSETETHKGEQTGREQNGGEGRGERGTGGGVGVAGCLLSASCPDPLSEEDVGDRLSLIHI